MTMPRSERGAERRQLTIVFCDLCDSTPLSTRLELEQTRDTLLTYQSACERVIARYKGFICRYLGDGILSYFGFPSGYEDAAERAVRASLEIVSIVATHTAPDGAPLAARVGIATGLVIVGDLIGSGAASEYAAVGEQANLAQRLQSIAPPGEVVIAASTRALLGGRFELRSLPAQVLKGFDHPVPAWVVQRVEDAATRFQAARAGRPAMMSIGRGTESAALAEHLRRAWAGEGHAVALVGEPGVGKSHLASWLVEHAARNSHTLLRFQASPLHDNSALRPVIAEFTRMAGLTPELPGPEGLAHVRRLLEDSGLHEPDSAPLLAALLEVGIAGDARPLEMSAQQQRDATLALLVECVVGLARRAPLLLLFEDLQWADPSSRLWIERLIERLCDAPVCALFTCRAAGTTALPQHIEIIELARLGLDDTRRLASALLPTSLRHDALLDRIVERSDGVPLFVEELVRAASERAAIRLGDDIPATLRDSLAERLDRMATAKSVAQVAAAIGREFDVPLLHAVADANAAELGDALAQLERAGLVSAHGNSQFRFRHALMQEAAYDTLLKSQRQALHARIAETLRDQFGSVAVHEPETLAHHFSLAGETASALEWWRSAGERAIARSAYAEAGTHFQRALAQAQTIAPSAEAVLAQLRLHVAHGQAMIALHGYAAPESTASFKAARMIADAIRDPLERFSVYHGLWAGSYLRGDLAPMREMADAFLREVSALGERPETGVAHRIAGATLAFEGRLVEAAAHLSQAVAAYRPERDSALALRFGHDTGVAAEANLALALWLLGDTERALRASDRALERAIASSHRPTSAYGHAYRCIFQFMRDRAADAASDTSRLTELSREHGMQWWLSSGIFFGGWVRWNSGEREVGREQMRQGMTLCRQHGLPSAPALFELLFARAEHEEGDPGAALTRLAALRERIRRTGEHWLEAEVLWRLGAADAAAHPDRSVLPTLREAAVLARSQSARVFELRALLAQARVVTLGSGQSDLRDEIERAVAGLAWPAELPEGLEAKALLLGSAGLRSTEH